jgi:hypothetical protein
MTATTAKTVIDAFFADSVHGVASLHAGIVSELAYNGDLVGCEAVSRRQKSKEAGGFIV